MRVKVYFKQKTDADVGNYDSLTQVIGNSEEGSITKIEFIIGERTITAEVKSDKITSTDRKYRELKNRIQKALLPEEVRKVYGIDNGGKNKTIIYR